MGWWFGILKLELLMMERAPTSPQLLVDCDVEYVKCMAFCVPKQFTVGILNVCKRKDSVPGVGAPRSWFVSLLSI